MAMKLVLLFMLISIIAAAAYWGRPADDKPAEAPTAAGT
jgi:hypothetical protein